MPPMRRARDLKVGLFVLAGLVFAGIVVFLIGDERRLFSSSVEYRARFADVQGLRPNAPVRMGGIDIGQVADVAYGTDPKDATIYVTLRIVEKEAGRIRTDSQARIAAKGLLGDKMVEITKGESTTGIPPGGEIPVSEAGNDVMGQVGEMAGKAQNVLENVEKATSSLADEQLHKDLHEAVAGMNRVLKQVSEGDGYPHRLLTDREEADRISRTMANLERASAELTLTLREVRSVVTRVQAGPGFAHDVIYGDGPSKQIQQFGTAAEEVATTLKGIRESDSFAHDVLYGGKGDGAEALSNVTALTGDLKDIIRDVKAGKGTVGALLVDPSIYEDMKMVLGNVQRNDVLRALVRYSIKQDEKKPDVKVDSPAPAPAPSP